VPYAEVKGIDMAKNEGFSAEERAAMKEYAKELKAKAENADLAKLMAEKIAELDEPDRGIAQRLHELITEAVPELAPKTYYGMPGWAKGGKVLVFFQPASKFKTRYGTLGFQDSAQLDDGPFWPSAFALTDLTPDVEKAVVALVKKAAG
jgi:uncharacterized protein YdhG (YjbR/CyaY superfamily)